MIDIAKQVAFWRDGAQEDLTVAEELLERGRVRHGFFFCTSPWKRSSRPMCAARRTTWLPGCITWCA